ncbi:MAG: hypothetical protein KGJ37_06780 [Verrucomicrobiota bacterium]|nr:hypothetical protein [Verrucomicrobiota bacterium]
MCTVLFQWIRRGSLAALLTAGTAWAEGTATQPLPQFEHLAPFKVITDVADQGAHISMEGIAPPLARSQLQVGDTVTALTSLYADRACRQWVVELKVVESKPLLSDHRGRDRADRDATRRRPTHDVQIISEKCGDNSKESAPKP